MAHVVHQEIAAEVEYRAAGDPIERDVGRGEFGVGAERVDEAAILPGDVDDQRLAGVARRTDLQGRRIDLVLAQGVGYHASEYIAADPPDDVGTHVHFAQVNGDISGASADREQELVGQNEFPGRGKMGDGCTDVVRN